MRAGRGLAVCRLELGNNASSSSSRLYAALGGVVVFVDVHLGTIPAFGKTCQARAKLRGMRLIDPERRSVNCCWPEECHNHQRFVRHIGYLREFNPTVTINAFDVPEHPHPP